MPPRTPPPDHAQRAAAVAERWRNVLIDAGAGTGKTTILVDRLVEMLVPSADWPGLSIDRIAAITFTRKAAGELRLRIRERVLEALAAAPPGSSGEAALRHALAGLDTAHVGTIHSFADRLLRAKPLEADLSPSYDVVDDEEALTHETFEVLMHAVESGTLATELAGTDAALRADEATAAVLDAMASGLNPATRDMGWADWYGLDALVAGFLRSRDVRPPDVPAAPADLPAFRAAAAEFVALARDIVPASPGARWIVRAARELERLMGLDDPIEIGRAVREVIARADLGWKKGTDFNGDRAAWAMWKAFTEGKDRARPLRQDLTAPIDGWLATRLVRAYPVVLALYEKVKARRRTLDQLDLLLKLRDLLVRDLDARRDYQAMFDHVFVDEFQDTDPLQAEIVLLLCEREPRAPGWRDVRLAAGKLTLVGDPKQSIYRFRRADVAMYDRVRQVVEQSDPLHVALTTNFRSRPPLIRWLNDGFARVLGVSAGRPFDPDTGQVFHRALEAGRAGADGPVVHVLPVDFDDGGKHGDDQYREQEGQALARYLRWLVEGSGVRVADPLDSGERPVQYGDVAILAVSTWQLPLLFRQLDASSIPYASRGGTLFLADPLHRQLLLGLRALADRDDGIAEAALLRPPFFALDPLDLLQERAARRAKREPVGEGEARARAAREIVRDLRRRRFDRAPGVTARDLLDRTAFARAIALGPNGPQRLARARELCLVLEQLAATEHLDYDGVTARMRAFVTDPVPLDPPHPLGTDAVHVLTVHQAKGLEFPVVVLWDGRGKWDTRLQAAPWRMERDGRGWTMTLHGLEWEEPAGLGLRETEKRFLDAERRRVAYVAATRARDLLVIPRCGPPAPRLVCATLLEHGDPTLVTELAAYRPGAPPPWAFTAPREPASRAAAEVVEGRLEAWRASAARALTPRFQPASVTGEAQARDDDGADPAARKPREGRFGAVFGSTVHLAIGLVVRDPGVAIDAAVRRAARRSGLAERLTEAAADVGRAIEALRAEGVIAPGVHLALEYPVAGRSDGGRLLSGYADLVAFVGDRMVVLDFKTDAPPRGDVAQTYPRYGAQIRTYGRLLAAASTTAVRASACGLLFTADGKVRWVDAPGVSASAAPRGR